MMSCKKRKGHCHFVTIYLIFTTHIFCVTKLIICKTSFINNLSVKFNQFFKLSQLDQNAMPMPFKQKLQPKTNRNKKYLLNECFIPNLKSLFCLLIFYIPRPLKKSLSLAGFFMLHKTRIHILYRYSFLN